MRITELAPDPADDERRAALSFVETVEALTGVAQLSDHLRLDLGRAAGAGTPGPLTATVRSNGDIVAFAQVSGANEASMVEVVVDPRVHDATDVRDDVVATIIHAHRARSEAPLVWWLDDPTAHDLAVAERFGLVVWRELYEMRRSLPHPERAEIATRDFRPGVDDDAWLRVNNRAFAGHGEQGGWTHDTLALRLAEPWFDPAGFRVYELDGEFVAFCWTKLHTDTEPVIGEIYVIAVDPAVHGRGLGKQLTLAGLDSISDRGVTVANLYVDAGNTPAVNLYRRLGFDIHRRRVALAPPDHAQR